VIVKLVESDHDLEAACRVLLQLRPAYTEESLLQAVREQRAACGYRLAGAWHAGEIACAAGFVIGQKLAWGRHIYVDDLVTIDGRRSRGAGAAMIAWLKEYARAQGCSQVHLDSGVTRYAAHRFYLRHGFEIRSHHFAISDLEETGSRSGS